MSSSLADELGAAAMKLLETARTQDRLMKAASGDPFPDDPWREVIAAGWTLTLVPEDQDGLGLGLAELGAIFRAVGTRCLRGPLLDHAVTLPLLLREVGAPEAPLLRDAIEGRSTIVWADAPGAPFGAGTAAVRYANGQADGIIDLVPFATRAHRLVVTAEGHDGTVLLLVTAANAGVTPMPSHDPALEYGRVRLSAAPATVLVAAPSASRLRDDLHGALRLMVASELSGGAAALVDMAVEYSKVRQQFGRPIAGFQAVRHLVARMATRANALENLVDAALADADADPRKLAERGIIAKAYAAQVARSIAEDCLQVHGGIGFTQEYPLHLYLRRALASQGYLGETSDLLMELGQAALVQTA